MSLTAQQKNELKKIVQMINQLLEEPQEKQAERKPAAKTEARRRVRRSGTELTRFRRQLKNDRKAGVPVAELAKKYGVTPSYIYQI